MLTHKESVDDLTKKIELKLSIFSIIIFEICYIVARIMHLFNSSNSMAIIIDSLQPIRIGLISRRRWTDALIAQ